MQIHENTISSQSKVLAAHVATQLQLARQAQLHALVTPKFAVVNQQASVETYDQAIASQSAFVADNIVRHMRRSGLTIAQALELEKEISDRPEKVWISAIELLKA